MRADGMARAAVGLGVAALLAGLALAGCGGSDEGAARAEPASGVETTATAASRKPGPPPGARACAHQVGEFLGGMATLRRNLVAGLDYEGYVGEVKRIRRSYEAIPVDSLALDCLRAAGTPGEKALNRYIAAGNTWTECVETSGCEAASIEAELQARWRQASRYLSRARHGLREPAAG